MKLLAAVLLVFAIAERACGKSISNTTQDHPRQPVYFGSVEGKSFFYEGTGMEWPDAKAYCSSFGMHLASFDTPAQYDFIQRISFGNGGCYWTSARDSQQPRQLTWDDSDVDFSRQVDRFGWVDSGPLSCGCVCPSPGTTHFSLYPCYFPFGILCET